MKKVPKVPKTAIAQARKLLRQRRVHMERVDLVRKLQNAGEAQRAVHMRNNLHNDAMRMDGELQAANRHGGMTMRQRQEHTRRIAELLQIAAGLAVR